MVGQEETQQEMEEEMSGKHTSGKVEVKHEMNIEFMPDHAGINSSHRPHEERIANAERITALWNASDGMSTHTVINHIVRGMAIEKLSKEMDADKIAKYIEHGAEMESVLRYWANNIPGSYPTMAIIGRAKDLLKKLEATK